jgi:bifunctional non-homologous end joining protein LigD
VLQIKQTLPAAVTGISPAKRPARAAAPALREYERKRDFSRTLEPRPELPRDSREASEKRFVVQKHEASHLHYDFRLEMHGVLKSWAVPKGVPYDLNQKRLAMATEDHPIEYLDFEGTIPEGQYGGGTVMVWDIGTFELIEGNYYKGKLQIRLRGKKLKGEWHLRKDHSGTSNRWFLMKTGDALKPPSAKKENASALTGRTMQQIAGDKSVQWHSNRTSIPGLDLDKLPQSEMRFVEPMLAKPVDELPEGANWQYEVKLDGYRAIAIKDAGAVRLISRRDNVLNDGFPRISAALQAMEDGLILDGEIVALDAQGRPSFSLLQHHRDNAEAIAFYAFDAIAYRKRDLRGLPLRQRRDVLNEVLQGAQEPIRISPVIEAKPDELISAVRSQGLEGIVAKRWDGSYESGERSGRWVKYRVNRGQELVIAGYRPGKDQFDALAAGYYDDAGRLIFVAKVKNGFTPDVKRQIFERFSGLETPTCPFDNLPEPKGARWGESLTPAAMKKFRWLKPKLVAQVEFTDWTSAHHLRHARFMGLRDDKDAKDVHRES